MRRLWRNLALRLAEDKGQTIVLVAVAMIVLLLFAGLAVDAGVIYVGKLHLSRSVDAAALAGAVELPFESSVTDTTNADQRALEFLAANGIQPTIFESSRSKGIIGSYRYRITVTYQVNLYFLPLVDFNNVEMNDKAMAEYNPLVDIYTNQNMATGVIQSSNQSIFGPDLCTSYGDPYTPSNSPWWEELEGKYYYRIYVPDSYPSDTLRVEIWDPDCYNAPSPSQVIVTNTQTLVTTTVSSPCGSGSRINPCLYNTGDSYNPFWFIRIDENRGNGTVGQCAAPGSYTEAYNTETYYRLFYYELLSDGTTIRHDLAQYTGQKNNADNTDMRWVSPGGSFPGDPPTNVHSGDHGSFEIDLNNDIPNIYVPPGLGGYYIYFEVEGKTGFSENGFDTWAGPLYPNVPSDVNARNVYVLINGPMSHSSQGVVMTGLGHLPMNSNTSNVVSLQLTYVDSDWYGRTIRVGLFDADSGASAPITFFFDTTVDNVDNPTYFDWGACFGTTSQCNSVGAPRMGDADIPNGNQWKYYDLTLPGRDVFLGGRLYARYKAGGHDTYGWSITGEAIPRLVE